MAAFVWADAVAGLWSVGANWQVAGVPQAAPPTTNDTVTFGSGTGFTQANCTLDTTGACSTIIFTGYTGTFNYSGQTLNVSGGTVTFVSGMTITSNSSSVINCSGAGVNFTGGTKSFGGLVSLTGSGIVSMISGNTFVNLTRTGTAAKTDVLELPGTTTVTGTLTLGGNTTQGVNRLLVRSSGALGAQRTFAMTGGAVVINGDVDFQDITITGTPSWTNTGSAFIGDGLGNGSLITTNKTTPTTQTATGTTSFTWSTHGWTSRVPLPQDTVSIPNAFSGGQTITADMPRWGADVSFVGSSGSPVLSTIASSIYGSLTLVSGVTQSGTANLTFAGRGSHTITSAGMTFTSVMTVDAVSGTYTLSDAYINNRSSNPSLKVTSGTFNDGGFSANLSGASGAFQITGATLVKSGAWSIAATAAASFVSGTGNPVVTDTGSITLSAASTNTRTFAGGGANWGTLTYNVTNSAGGLTLTGANTFTALNVAETSTNPRTLIFPAATTTTITNLYLYGLNVQSSVGASAATLSIGGTIFADYLPAVQDITATGTNFLAAHSRGVSGNTGITFNDSLGNYGKYVSVGNGMSRAEVAN